ncbi:MAG: 50S ribosomal protein L11 methyltransferase [Chloracidobacterium sp.]|uniref:50S ribosomal protein L11 methyltransferase n=1 Tax=Chloracidobacterium validum TaxID=2821543 RepID=A0ABX8BCN9_9BACT|nr:50S ribosomal protein L11 methyltransferase [Chloracidobacterium validum]QUW03580.1 50S ribosomal protein L11 methyltransferase [Chloracidobacterium validum]
MYADYIALTYHASLIADEVRVRAFQSAIEAVVRPGDIVADVGCGTGILTLLACRAGARHVYAIDEGPIIELAKQIVEQNGYAAQVTLINRPSRRANLPVPVDVIVSETIGNYGAEELILSTLSDACRRWLKPGGKVIPQRLELYCAPIAWPKTEASLSIWHQPVCGFDFSPGLTFAVNQQYPRDLCPAHLLAQGICYHRLELSSAVLAAESLPKVSGTARFSITQPGVMGGVGAWFNAWLTDHVHVTNDPRRAKTSWGHLCLPIAEPLPVTVGDEVDITLRAVGGGSLLCWEVVWRGVNGQSRAFRHSDFEGWLSTPEQLHPLAPTAAPGLGVDGRIQLFLLTKLDAGWTIEQTARGLHEQFAAEFPTLEDALIYVKARALKVTKP